MAPAQPQPAPQSKASRPKSLQLQPAQKPSQRKSSRPKSSRLKSSRPSEPEPSQPEASQTESSGASKPSPRPKSSRAKSPRAKSPRAKPPQPKPPATTGHWAVQIARALSKGRPPAFSDDFEEYCENSPHEIFTAFAGVVQHMHRAGKDDMGLAAYLFVLQRLLEHLRYRTDSGYAEAAKLIADFQAHVVAKVEAGEVDGKVLALVGGVLHQSTIPASPAFVAASANHGACRGEGEMLPADIHVAVGEILELCDGDPFLAATTLFESSHALPPESRGELACTMALSGIAEARSVTVLLLLDPDATVRRMVAGVLGDVATSLSSVDVRRLIAIRNWRPERERGQVDAIVRKARAAGIACAQWGEGSAESLIATSVDGVGAQVFFAVSPDGRKKRMSSILTKGGVADAWTTDPGSRREIEDGLASARSDVPTLEVSRAYLDGTVAHHLALMTERGEVPPPGLLQVAETIGGAGWQPARMDFGEALGALIAEIPKTMREPAALASLLRQSGEAAEVKVITLSWYEDDPEVLQTAKGVHARRAKLATYLLQTVIGRRRERWTEIVLRAALWMREAPPKDGLCWRELALVAKALADGQDMTEIGLMHDVALRTITVLKDTGPI
jgi:hypothetical protein